MEGLLHVVTDTAELSKEQILLLPTVDVVQQVLCVWPKRNQGGNSEDLEHVRKCLERNGYIELLKDNQDKQLVGLQKFVVWCNEKKVDIVSLYSSTLSRQCRYHGNPMQYMYVLYVIYR